MTVSTSHVSGLVLAGGLSRRMFSGRGGAGDKGLLEIGHRPMIAHVIDRLRPQVGRLAINANGDPARFAAFGLPVVADTVEGFVGPLAGVLAGLRWAAGTTPDARWVATVSSDAPFLPVDLVARLAGAVSDRGNAISIARSDDGLHPVIGLWPIALADDLEAALRAGLRKVLHWTDKHGTVPVEFDSIRVGDARVDPFFNANTPEELDEARRLMIAAERHSQPAAEEHR
jgi:molybdopterin-guanine dinucleotide biosynthesis protein A